MPERQLRMIREDLDGLPDYSLPAGYELRTYQPGDESAWADVMNTGIGDGWTYDRCRDTLTGLPQFKPDSLFFIVHQGQPVGSACAWTESLDEATTGQIHMVCVKPGHRGKRLGWLVTLAALHYMRDNGFSAAWLGTDDFRLPAIKAYLDLGFVADYLEESHRLRWAVIFAKVGGLERWGRDVFPDPVSSHIRECGGNRAVLVVMDESQKRQFDTARRTVLPVLYHLGIPYRVLNLSVDREPSQSFDVHLAVILAQENIGDSMSEALAKRVITFVESGGGLISYDPYIDSYPPSLRAAIPVGISHGTMNTGSLHIQAGHHFITKYQEPYKEHQLTQPVSFTCAETAADGDVLVQTEANTPGLVVGLLGRGRVAQFLLDQSLWTTEVYGRCTGLDDVFWRAIAWASRKPFIMKAMPRFVTWRVYDVTGRGGFQRVRSLTDLAWRPHLSLITEELEASKWEDIAELAGSHRVDCMPQTLGPHADLLYDHDAGTPLSDGDLSSALERAFSNFDRYGIQTSRSIHINKGQYGRNAVSALLDRHVAFILSGLTPIDDVSDPAPEWSPSPYGRPEFMEDRLLGYPEIFVAVSGEPADVATRRTDHEDSTAERVIQSLRIALAGRFHGSIVLSERTIASFTDEAWAAMMHKVDLLIAEFRGLRVPQDTAAEYARNKMQTLIEYANLDPQSNLLNLTLSGGASLPVEIQVYDESCREHALKIEAFEDGGTYSFDLNQLVTPQRREHPNHVASSNNAEDTPSNASVERPSDSTDDGGQTGPVSE